MAKKKAPAQELPLEQQPLFLKTLEFLPVERGELEQLAGDMLQLFNDAMIAASARDIETSTLRYSAVVYRLNGDTFMGSGTKEGPGGQLRKLLAARPGVVPGWGQAGEYLLEVDGMRVRVVVDPWGVGGVHSLSFWAVDSAAKFISETGYMSHFLHPDQHVGKELAQAVRLEFEGLLQGERKPRAIREDERGKVSVPAWLAPVLQGVTRNGQLNMPLAGEPVLSEPVEKVPLSNAERQRRHRERQKELSVTEGLKLIPLTSTDRMVLSLGVLAHEDLFHRPDNWATSKKPGFDALLTKLWPEGDNGRYLAEPERSTRRPAAFLRDELERKRTENLRLIAALNSMATEAGGTGAAPVARSLTGQALDAEGLNREVDWVVRELNKATAEVDALKDRLKFIGPPALVVDARHDGDFLTLEVTDAPLLGVWKELRTDFARCATALGLLRLRNNQHAELAHAVKVLQQRLRDAGLSDRITTDKKEWYWNTSPIGDYRATSAPEYMERLSTTSSAADERAAMAARIESLEREQALLEAERNKAFQANYTMAKRLKKAGLSTDYREQPGE